MSRAGVIVPIPRPLTSLIGREQEVQHLYDALRSDVRLATITGFGGVGKTRLSLQVALELEPDFEAGVVFAPLAPVTVASSVPVAIAQIAGLDESIHTVHALADALGPESRLLVLDNLEQIPNVAGVVLDLLQAMPQLRILATSRSSLDIRGEHVYPLHPLATRADDSRLVPAERLFIERGSAALPHMPTDDASIAIIADICQQLDGIPLAIELAAARLAIFSLPDLRTQLQNQLSVLSSSRADLPDRQKTMRNAISWTYDLLEPAEQRLFNWLSVYEGGFNLDSIRHVTTALELTDDPLDVVQFLVSRSLARPIQDGTSTPRYQMLQMLREYGHEQLRASSEVSRASRSHANDMAIFAERADPHLTTSQAGIWMARLRDDVANLLHALMWTNANGEHELGQRILGAAWRYPDANGMARRFLEVQPNTGEGTGSDLSRARTLVGIGYLYEGLRQLEPAKNAFAQAINLAKDLEDQAVHMRALTGLGTVEFDYSNLEAAENLLQQAKVLANSIGELRGFVVANGILGNVLLQTGDLQASAAVFEDVVRQLEKSGDHVALAMSHNNLGIAYQRLNRIEDADACFRTSLTLSEQHQDLIGMISAYTNLSGNCVRMDRLDEALKFAEKGIPLARAAGLIQYESVMVNNHASVSHRRQDWGTTAQGMMRASELMNLDGGAKEQIDFASAIAEICLALDLRHESAELLGAVIAMREELQVAASGERESAEQEALEVLNPDSNPQFARAMEKGAGNDREALVKRIREIGNKIIAISPPKKSLSVKDVDPLEHLTPRETEVLTMVAKGLSNAEIADEMFVSTRTITTHLTNIFGKLEVNNRSRAAAIATQAGLV